MVRIGFSGWKPLRHAFREATTLDHIWVIFSGVQYLGRAGWFHLDLIFMPSHRAKVGLDGVEATD